MTHHWFITKESFNKSRNLYQRSVKQTGRENGCRYDVIIKLNVKEHYIKKLVLPGQHAKQEKTSISDSDIFSQCTHKKKTHKKVIVFHKLFMCVISICACTIISTCTIICPNYCETLVREGITQYKLKFFCLLRRKIYYIIINDLYLAIYIIFDQIL